MDSPVYYGALLRATVFKGRHCTHKLKVLEVGDDLFGKGGGALLERAHSLGIRLLELGLDARDKFRFASKMNFVGGFALTRATTEISIYTPSRECR